MGNNFKPKQAELPPDLAKVLEGVQAESGFDMWMPGVLDMAKAASAISLGTNMSKAVETVLQAGGFGPQTEGRDAYEAFARRAIELHQSKSLPKAPAPKSVRNRRPSAEKRWELR